MGGRCFQRSGVRGVDAAARILDAADELFGEIGFDGTSTREIAERAGVNKALIHYHYESKDALLESLLVAVLRPAQRRDALCPGVRRRRLRSQFGHLIDCYFDFLVANRNFARIVQREATGGPHTELLWQRMEFMFQADRRVIELQFPASAGTDLDRVRGAPVVSRDGHRHLQLQRRARAPGRGGSACSGDDRAGAADICMPCSTSQSLHWTNRAGLTRVGRATRAEPRCRHPSSPGTGGLSGRILSLRRRYQGGPAHLSVQRARYFTRGWQATEGIRAVHSSAGGHRHGRTSTST